MGKKRKAGSKPSGQLVKENFRPDESKLNIRTYEDVADSEDEFHINRDKVLLAEEPARKRQRLRQEADAFVELSDEEVLGEPDELADFDVDNSDESEESEGEEQDKRKSGSKRRNESDSEAEDEEENAEEGWGDSKREYYNADAIETEADALDEEEEALRLQKKQLQNMAEADYGFDEVDWLEAGKENKDGEDMDGVVQEILPGLANPDSMTPEERSKILALRYPEFELLAQEFLALQPQHEDLVLAEAAAQSVQERLAKTANNVPIASVKCKALGGYLAALSMYFAVLTSGTNTSDGQPMAKPPAELRDHPIMETLVQCRSLWDKLKDIAVPDVADMVSSDKALVTTTDSIVDQNKDEYDSAAAAELKAEKPKKKRRSKAEKAAARAQAEDEAHVAERKRRVEERIARLPSITSNTATRPQKAKAPLPAEEDDSDFGEETSLTVEEAAEKAQRKKGLRFYTSKIALKANKRGTAGRDAGGDADIPYRERHKDRVARLNAAAEAKGKKPGKTPADALGGDSDHEDTKVSKEVREDGDEDYYEFVAAKTKEKKDSKAARGAAHKEAAAIGAQVREIEEVGADGKRAITYAIEKNKGLMPKRNKDVRNPRVKKRKKYEEKKKKLGSIRQVYKGGEGRGGYGGELTGIKTNLVKSVKL